MVEDIFMQNVLLYFRKFRNLILYGIIGAFSAGVDFLFYTLLTHTGMNYLLANVLSVGVGIITSFILNRHYNFRVKDKVIRRFMIFLLVGVIGLLLSSLILYLLINVGEQDVLISKLVSIVVVALVQFVLNKYITFGKSLKISNYESSGK